MLKIRFQKQDKGYQRQVTLPDGSAHTQDNVAIPEQWYIPKRWRWERQFYEFPRETLEKEGGALADTLLGIHGVDEVRDNPDLTGIVINENKDLPDIFRVPWELACVDGEFVCTDRSIPIIRQPDLRPSKRELKVHSPLRMALLSASPKDESPLQLEEEMLSLSLALGDPMAEGKIIVDEVLNCTRGKLQEIFRSNQYDIVYFTGHGGFRENTGSLVLEGNGGASEPMPAGDFASALRGQKSLSLVFLNCCNAAKVGEAESVGQKGFRDVARRVLRLGVPEVIATQASIFDATGRKIMKTFFEALCTNGDFDVAEALTSARVDVAGDTGRFGDFYKYHDFYHFVHLRSREAPVYEIVPRDTGKQDETDWRKKVRHDTSNYMKLDNNFIGRFAMISRIEDMWWDDSFKTIGLHGIGGIGKTFLCNRMEQRGLTHAVDKKRLEQSIWIDFREGKGDSLAGFITQLAAIASDLGFPVFRTVLDDHEQYPSPFHKLRPLSEHLESRFKGKVLLVLDNMETVVNQAGEFKDPVLGEWFQSLISHTPLQTRILVTCRHHFNFYPEGRQLAKSGWLHLTELGYTERMGLINQTPELRALDDQRKGEVLKAAGGHPYLLYLVVSYLQCNPDLPEAVKNASKDTAAYSRLDDFLGLLSAEAIDWLVIMAVFPEPKHAQMIMVTKAILENAGDPEALAPSYQAAVSELGKLSLIKADQDGGIFIHPLVVFQLTGNVESAFYRSPDMINRIHHAVGVLFYNLAENRKERQAKVQSLRHGIESVLAQDDMELVGAYVQSCAEVFHGFVPVSVFLDITSRTEQKLMQASDQIDFAVLWICAQELSSMRDFDNAYKLLNRLLEHQSLPDHEKARIYGIIGKIWSQKRQWKEAIENYELSNLWAEKTEDEQSRGVTYHQIGRVYEQQREWSQALDNYGKALEWNEKSGNHFEMGGTYHQIGRVYEEDSQIDKALDAYLSGLTISIKTGSEEYAGGNFNSLRRIAPKLSEDSVQKLKNDVPEEVFKEICKE